MPRIVITRGDGGVSTMDLDPGQDVDGWIDAWKKNDGPRWGGYVSHQEVPFELLPSDHTFFDAWQFVGGAIQVDMPKAREVQKEWLRYLRKPLFEKNDSDLSSAIAENDQAKIATAIAKRDALRDVTDDPAIAAATTPEELKAVLPDALKDEGAKP